MKISEILTDRSKWTKGMYAKDSRGKKVGVDDPSAKRFCLVGAAKKAGVELKLLQWFDRQEKRLDWTDGIIAWNDEPRRTFLQVRRLVRAFERGLR